MKPPLVLLRVAAGAAALAAFASAFAQGNPNNSVIRGSDFTATHTYTEALNPLGASATFTAGVGASKLFELKSQDGYTGVGVRGGTAGEIDTVTESITGVLTRALVLDSFSVSLLFNGPEYGDYKEKAHVRVGLANGSFLDGVLQASGANTTNGNRSATWSLGGSVVNLDPAIEGQGGAWRVDNPFGNVGITSIVFTADVSNDCVVSSCNNQSDYSLHRLEFSASPVTAVPEPETYALMLAGLGLLGFAGRRRRQKEAAAA